MQMKKIQLKALILLMITAPMVITTIAPMLEYPNLLSTTDLINIDSNTSVDLSVAEITSVANFTFEKNIENGEIYSNGTHKRAVIYNEPKYVYDNETDTYRYYKYINRNGRHFIRSTHGVWELSKQYGVVLLKQVDNRWEKVFNWENWTLIYQGSPQQPTDQEVILNYRNSENASISLIETFPDGWLNETYSWIRGRLKLSVGMRARSNGNYRVVLQIGGLDLEGFTRHNVTQLNTSKYMLNFDDMKQHIDVSQSSYTNGILSLVSNNYVLSPSDERVFDPTMGFTPGGANWYSMWYDIDKQLNPDYQPAQTDNIVGFYGSYWFNFINRAWYNFNLSDLLGQQVEVISANFNMTVRTQGNNPAGVDDYIMALGRNISVQPPVFADVPAQDTPEYWDETYLDDSANYNTTIRLGDQHPTVANENEYTWNVTDFTQEWFDDKGGSVDKISWQARFWDDVNHTSSPPYTNRKALIFYRAGPYSYGKGPELEIVYSPEPPAFLDWHNGSLDVYPMTDVNLFALIFDLDNHTTEIILTIFYSNDSFVTDNRSFIMVYNSTTDEDTYNYTYTWTGEINISYQFYYTANDSNFIVGKYNPTVGSYFNLSWRDRFLPIIVAWFDSTLLIDPFADVLFDCTINDEDNGDIELNVTIRYSVDGFALDNRSRQMNFAVETSPDHYKFTYNWIGEPAGTFYQYYYQVQVYDDYYIIQKPEAYDVGILFDIQWDLIVEEVVPPPGSPGRPGPGQIYYEKDYTSLFWFLLLLIAIMSVATFFTVYNQSNKGIIPRTKW